MHVPHPFALKRERKNRQIRQLFLGAPMVHIVCDSCKLFYYFVGWVDRSRREIWSLDGCDKKSNFTVIARYKFSLKFMWFVCESQSSNNDDCRREKIFHSQTHQFKTILECTKSQATTSYNSVIIMGHTTRQTISMSSETVHVMVKKLLQQPKESKEIENRKIIFEVLSLLVMHTPKVCTLHHHHCKSYCHCSDWFPCGAATSSILLCGKLHSTAEQVSHRWWWRRQCDVATARQSKHINVIVFR